MNLLYLSATTNLDVGGKYFERVVVHGAVFVGTDRIQAFGGNFDVEAVRPCRPTTKRASDWRAIGLNWRPRSRDGRRCPRPNGRFAYGSLRLKKTGRCELNVRAVYGQMALYFSDGPVKTFAAFSPARMYPAGMPNLHSNLATIAASFTDSVLAAIRSASLAELLAETGGGKVGKVPPMKAETAKSAPRSKPAPTSSSGRLHRRSDEEIMAALDQVVALVKKNKDGLRAETIREGLGLQAKELPRILKTGLSKKKLKSKGQKRATTYLAA